MFNVDLHTHSVASPDGGISAAQYKRVLEKGILDCVAITDHNTIDFATRLQTSLGDRIIVGEEIMTNAGEIIGLFLTQAVQPGLTPLETVQLIKAQGGLVYIPHPFETIRKGLHPAVLEDIVDFIDIIEICNGRAFVQNRSSQTVVWTKLNHKLGAASSDAHGLAGIGRTYTRLSALPTRDTLLELLSTGTPITRRASLRALLYPKYHRFKRKVGGA
jgi:predicted metal-dependent phosphoesterase TrpH